LNLITYNRKIQCLLTITIGIALFSLSSFAQVFIPFGFWKPGFIHNFGTYRAYTDGTYAISCDRYRNPTSSTYHYDGNTGDGTYRIQPVAHIFAFDVYCDMTNDSGGWMLAAVPRRAVAKMSETTGLLDPTQTSAGRNAEIWGTASTVPFTQLRFTNNWPTPTSKNIATWGSAQTFSGLLTTYSTYERTNVVLSGGSISSTIGSTCFIIRGKSRDRTPYNDEADWLWMGFHSRCTTPFSDNDDWDTTSGSTQWVVGGKDNGDGILVNTSVGINSSNKHWNYDNTATYDVDTRTIIWVK
jgi:Fibrinogen beta and gamma chains, C-terminal globular domain